MAIGILVSNLARTEGQVIPFIPLVIIPSFLFSGIIVAVDRRYFRPTEVDTLLGDASKARQKLGWRSRTSFGQLVSEMVAEDLREAERDSLCQQEGFRTFNHFE